MSTTVTTKTGCQIDVEPDGLALGNDAVGCRVSTALTPDEARLVAAALTADQGGHWTREESTSEGDIARVVDEVTEGDWTRQDLVDALWAEVSGENRRREDAAVAAFKTAWAVADEMGDTGNRVRRGLRAALDTIDHWAGAKNDR